MDGDGSVELSAEALEVLEWLAALGGVTLDEAASMAQQEGLRLRQEAHRQGGSNVIPFCRPRKALIPLKGVE